MVDLCSREYSNYLKYHARHHCRQQIAKFSIFFDVVCFVCIEEM